MKSDKLYLTHIVECIGNIEDYTQDGYSAFIQSRKTQDAVSVAAQACHEET
jgi:uncharacterized protein with HEPN domain